jgi:dihydrofolate reductase
MGKIIVANIVSLDGNYEGPDKNVMALPMDGAFDTFNLEHMKAADVILLGENSYKFFGGFWPVMADNPDASETNQEFSRRYNKIQKIVVSHTITEADFPEAWKTTTQITKGSPYDELTQLKKNTAGDIVIFASRILWNDLLAHGLVDELHLMVGNVFLGKEGTPLFEETIVYDDPKTNLKLLDTKKCENSNNHIVYYAVKTGQKDGSN